LRAEAGRDPAIADGVLTRAKRLRASMRNIFFKLADGKQPTERDLGVLNFDLAASLSHARVWPTGADGGFAWGWAGRNLDAPIWPITRSAADLLTSETERGLVRECGADDCRWLFLDTTKNRSRQWCSMQSCGNRQKARRHYQRLRQSRGGEEASGLASESARGARPERRR
jgi:predicted RNA-binding Zn ribbon-like protein